jgi:hypothetical protein
MLRKVASRPFGVRSLPWSLWQGTRSPRPVSPAVTSLVSSQRCSPSFSASPSSTTWAGYRANSQRRAERPAAPRESLALIWRVTSRMPGRSPSTTTSSRRFETCAKTSSSIDDSGDRRQGVRSRQQSRQELHARGGGVTTGAARGMPGAIIFEPTRPVDRHEPTPGPGGKDHAAEREAYEAARGAWKAGGLREADACFTG